MWLAYKKQSKNKNKMKSKPGVVEFVKLLLGSLVSIKNEFVNLLIV